MERRHPWRHLRRSGKDKDCQQGCWRSGKTVRRHPWRHLWRSGKDKDCQQVVDPGRGVRREVLAVRQDGTPPPWRHLRRSGKDKDCQQVVDPGRGVRREVLAVRQDGTPPPLAAELYDFTYFCLWHCCAINRNHLKLLADWTAFFHSAMRVSRS